jgi:predicted O-methyltransferase YrrM
MQTHEELLAPIIREHHGASKGFARHYLTLYSLILGLEAKSVLEVGMGFSTPTIMTALGQTGGSLTSCDMRTIEGTGNDPESLKQFPRWTFLQGKTDDTLKTVTGPFDLVLHDGSHEFKEVYRDLRTIIPMIRQNGLLLVHDTEHGQKNFKLRLAVRLALLFKRHESVTLPYGYGLTIVRLLGNKKNGKVEIKWEKESGAKA